MHNRKHGDKPEPQPAPRPIGTRIRFTSSSTSLAFFIPRLPLGFSGSSIVLLIAVAMAVMAWTPWSPYPIGPASPSGYVIAIFITATAVFVAAFNVQFLFQTTEIVATTDSLVITAKGPLRSRRQIVSRDSLKSVFCQESHHLSPQNYMPPTLSVCTADGGLRSYLDDQPVEDLKWIAGTLEAFYKLQEVKRQ